MLIRMHFICDPGLAAEVHVPRRLWAPKVSFVGIIQDPQRFQEYSGHACASASAFVITFVNSSKQIMFSLKRYPGKKLAFFLLHSEFTG
jgi:hypothetical protein